MKYFKKMVGKKCYLSPINPEDVEKYVLWLNDMDILAEELTGGSCLPPLSPPE